MDGSEVTWRGEADTSETEMGSCVNLRAGAFAEGVFDGDCDAGAETCIFVCLRADTVVESNGSAGTDSWDGDGSDIEDKGTAKSGPECDLCSRRRQREQTRLGC